MLCTCTTAAHRWSPAAIRPQTAVDGTPGRCWGERHTEQLRTSPERGSHGAASATRSACDCRSATGPYGHCATCPSRCPRERRRRSSAATAPANRRCCAPSSRTLSFQRRRASRAARITLDGRPLDGLSAGRGGRRGRRPGPGGAAGVRADDRRRQSARGRTRRAPAGARTGAAALRRVHELFPVLADRAHQRAGLLSGGEQQMLAIGRALMAAPAAAAARRAVARPRPADGGADRRDRAGDQRRRAPRSCSSSRTPRSRCGSPRRAYVLEVGEVTLSGPADELAASDEVRRRYLGVVDEDARGRRGRTRPRRR